jgi:8-oxo-dGTP pyrophosphatase MutT (NUDIX family)/ribosomal protein S18 acetylase RimI-like enzyme
VPVVIRQLSGSDTDGVASLWQSAADQRRADLGIERIRAADSALSRPGAFGVGLFEGDRLLSMAVALPALADNARSEVNVPGLAHISSVATLPGRWGEGLAGRCVQAIMMQATRRGYARAQLWTHASNVGAQHLYERKGFERTGRQTIDDHDEPIVHYHRDLAPVPWEARPAARLVCLDAQDRILLLHWRDPYDGYRLWEPPGGGIESGETPYDAAIREWEEETGLPAPEIVGQPTTVARDVIFNGTRGLADEHFFFGRLATADEPRVDQATEMEQDTYLGHAWVDWRDLVRLDDPLEPDLVPILRRLAPAGPWLV